MIASMTGFARREVATAFGHLVCELRSVNHRFLDATVRTPDVCRGLEPELRQSLSRTLKRGKVDCTVTLRGTDPAAATLEIDEVALQRVLATLTLLSSAVREPAAKLDLLELLRYPGVLRQDAVDSEAVFGQVREVFAATVGRSGGRPPARGRAPRGRPRTTLQPHWRSGAYRARPFTRRAYRASPTLR